MPPVYLTHCLFNLLCLSVHFIHNMHILTLAQWMLGWSFSAYFCLFSYTNVRVFSLMIFQRSSLVFQLLHGYDLSGNFILIFILMYHDFRTSEVHLTSELINKKPQIIMWLQTIKFKPLNKIILYLETLQYSVTFLTYYTHHT